MASSITFSGLGSGLDTRAIIDALVAAERVPITLLANRAAQARQKISLLGTLRGLVDELRDKAAVLGTLSTFSSYAVTSSDASLATISASGSASAGSHTLEVLSLASVDRWAFDGVTDPDAPLGTVDGQEVSFSYEGTTYLFRETVANSSLNNIAAGINSASGGQVTASVVNAGTSASPSWQLVLSGSSSGASKRISSIASTFTGLTINASAPVSNAPASPNNLTVANDAVALIDGLQVTRETNEFNDVLAGISITALRTNAGAAIAFTVAADKEAIQGRIAGFVEAYNAVVEFMRDQQSYSEDTGAGGPLFGESVLRRVRDVLDDQLFGTSAAQIAADTGGYGTLRLLGIEAQSDGTLEIDAGVLAAKLDADVDAFTDFFVDSDGFDNGGAPIGSPGYYVDLTADSGFGDDLARALDTLTESFGAGGGTYVDGVFDARNESLEREIELFEDRIEQRERRLEQFEAQLEARFAALESLMAQLNAQSAYLSQNLSPVSSGGSD